MRCIRSGRAYIRLFDQAVVVAALALDHVSRPASRGCPKTDQRHAAIERLADAGDGIEHAAQRVHVRHGQLGHVGLGAHGLAKRGLRPRQTQAQAHGASGTVRMSLNKMAASAGSAPGLQRHFGGVIHAGGQPHKAPAWARVALYPAGNARPGASAQAGVIGGLAAAGTQKVSLVRGAKEVVMERLSQPLAGRAAAVKRGEAGSEGAGASGRRWFQRQALGLHTAVFGFAQRSSSTTSSPAASGTAGGIGVGDADLHPQKAGPNGDGIFGNGGDFFALPKAIDQVNLHAFGGPTRCGFAQAGKAHLAQQQLAVHARIHRHDAVALGLQVAGDLGWDARV